MGTRRLLAVLALVACAAASIDAAGPKTRYERVLAQEQTLRLRTRRPAPLSQIRKVVAAYEAVVRRHPTSGYADNALLQGADLSLTAHRLYGSDVDRDVAARMLQWLIDEYPHTSLLSKARQMLRRAKPASRPPTSRAASAADAPAATRGTTSRAASEAAPADAPASGRGAASSTARRAASTSDPAPALPSPTAASASPAADVPAASGTALALTSTPAAATSAGTRAGAPLRATLKQITRAALPDIVRVTLEFDGEVEYKQDQLAGPARLYFDLKRTQTAPQLQDAVLSYSDDTVRHIRLGRPKDDLTRLVIDLTGVEKYSVFTLYNPYRLTVDLHRKAVKLAPLVARSLTGVAAPAPRLTSASVPKDFEARRIPPRPLPHPLADTPRITSRRVAADVNRPKPPIVGARRGLPLSVVMRAPVAATPVAATLLAAAASSGSKNASRSGTKGDSKATQTAAAKVTPPPLPNRASAPPVLPAPVTPSANAAGSFSLARQLGLGVSRIVIDAGHGGHDPGSLGSKVTESEIVLDVALRLEKLLLKEPGFEVVLTRRTDVFIPLEERPAIANRLGADLFLSIHANSSRNRQAHGIETYVLNFANTPESEAVAARENAGATQTMNHLPEIVKAIALNNKLDESRDFAGRVQETMAKRLRAQNAALQDRGVKQAPLVVLVGTGMPAVLAEIAFISNQQEGSLLRTQSYRQRIAEALFEAVKDYQRALKTVGTVAAQVGETEDR